MNFIDKNKKPFLVRIVGYTPRKKPSKTERIASNISEAQNGQIRLVKDCRGCLKLVEQFEAFNPEKKNNRDDRINTISDAILRTDLIKPSSNIERKDENLETKDRDTWSL